MPPPPRHPCSLLLVPAGASALTLRVYSGGAVTALGSSYTAPPGVWLHFVATLDALGNAALYVNGAPTAGAPLGVAKNVTRSHLYLARGAAWRRATRWPPRGRCWRART